MYQGEIQQSSAVQPLLFLLISSSDHITGLTGATPTVTISKNGAAFAAPSGAVTEIGNGWYKVAANATDSNTLGPIALHATAASADPFDDVVALVVAFNPQSATNLGLTDLDATISSRMASGNVTVGGYAAGEDPGTLVLATPANKLATDGSGRVTVGTNADKTGYGLANGAITGATFGAVSEVGAGALPGATPDPMTAVQFLYQLCRQRRTTTAAADTFYNNAGAAVGSAAVSDDGTTFSRGQYS